MSTLNAYYTRMFPETRPLVKDPNSISKIPGECIEYYWLYYETVHQYSSYEPYSTYEHYIEEWMNTNYIDAGTVKSAFSTAEYMLVDKLIYCSKYSYETPYNTLYLHIEHTKDDPKNICICICILAKLTNDPKTFSEKTALTEYLEMVRDIIVKTNKKINDDYYTECQEECAIEYARDHC